MMNILSANIIRAALSTFLQLLTLFYYVNAMAETRLESKSSCLIVKVPMKATPLVSFTEASFADGTLDLAILVGEDRHRVTFSLPVEDERKASNCRYQTLAISQGVNDQEQWGWHLAWADNQAIYYARMDGVAWVSSVPKKIKINEARDLHFEQQQNLLTLSWKTADGGCQQIVSDDEGRSWSDITPH